MAIITLTTDWGISDHYIAAVKGLIISRLPGAMIVDISHAIEKFSISHAAYVLEHSYKNFPDGSIHIVGVDFQIEIKEDDDYDPETIEVYHAIVCYNKHYFVGLNNGIFTLLCNNNPDKIIKISAPPKMKSFIFPAYTIYAGIACEIASGTPVDKLGVEKKKLFFVNKFKPAIQNDSISGIVAYIDSYGNAITNISMDEFEEVRGKRNFAIYFRNHTITKISRNYSEETGGELMALFGSSGMLEIAVVKGSAKKLLGAGFYDSIRVDFA
ncbi:MAG: SAM-dependent chlorinase/fluorinase [Bacteroidales bacterium]|jgi:hypothetical protein|nr:SAM-dependent chlorinase/fluorinase [Bacteroidales bacterium]MDD4214074.1 SAM-dependent chlorinase/fluorinase [Bacteroidales bacterium]